MSEAQPVNWYHTTHVKRAFENRSGHQTRIPTKINLLKPTGHVMHREINIQQLYDLPTLYLCVLHLSENNQQLFLYTVLSD